MKGGQCPSCLRPFDDWASRHAEGKEIRRKDIREVDRMADYRDWRWGFGGGAYVSDIDQIEWRLFNEEPVPVALLELTRLDGDTDPLPLNYLKAVLDRYRKRDGQGSAVRVIAEKIGVDAIIVLFRYDLREFWLYNLTTSEGWHHASKAAYEQWIRSLSRKASL